MARVRRHRVHQRQLQHGVELRERHANDQSLAVNPCRLPFLHQGMDPSASGPYNPLPWRLGLLRRTNSPG
ncbi:hypothetical protein ACFZBP_35420 [Streptomyces sp. NPDC008086]|uniref:hypothetical protein n=1 Tax=Streptomyces sp. NPDC008086 TaxID=3364807 RepID=UPI0036DFBC75